MASKTGVDIKIESEAFAQIRNMITSNWELACKVAKLEAAYDEQFAPIFQAIRQWMDDKAQPSKSKRKIGFI